MNTDTRSRPISAYFVLAVGILAVSSASILIRFAQREASSLVIAAYRLTIAACILIPINLRRSNNELRQLSLSQLGWLSASGLFLAFHFASWITSLEMTSVVSSVVLVATTPLWVALFSPLLLKEKVPGVVWWGVGLSMAGSLIVAASSICGIDRDGLSCTLDPQIWTGKNLLGNGLALIGAWCAAGYMIIGRRLRQTLLLPVYTLGVYGTAAVALVIMAAASGANFIGTQDSGEFHYFSLAAWLCMVGLALGPQLLGHTSYNWALGYLPATTVSVALLGEPIGTTILAYLFLREPPALMEIAGGFLILLGIYITSRVAAANKNGQLDQG